MIKDQTLDEAIIEIARTLKALKKLRTKRKGPVVCLSPKCSKFHKPFDNDLGQRCLCGDMLFPTFSEVKEHAAAKRASMDLTRKLADLRAGR